MAVQTAPGAAGDMRATPRLGAGSTLRIAVAGLLGFGCGISAFLQSYYDLAVWGWIGLGLLAALLVLFVGAGAPRRPAFWIAVGGLVALWAWALLSSTWGESSSQAILVANRWLVYAAFLAVASWLLRDRWAALALLGGVAAGGVAIVAHLAVELLGSGAPALFVGRRLADPIGYVNGLGTYVLVGAFWPAVAVAERARPIVLSALGAGMASLAASLLVLTQSRGVAAAAAVSIVVVLAAIPGRLPRAWLLVLVGGGLAAAAPTLLDVYSSTTALEPTRAAAQSAGEAALLVAAVVALLWGAGLSLFRALPESAARAVAGVGLGAILFLAVAGVIALVVLSGRISDDVSRQYDAFVHPGQPAAGATASASRLTSGSGNRYDYWRIAWHDFTDHPVRGVGAGNWPVSYFLERTTSEDVRQPHSVELQALSELGIVGGLALLVFVVGVYVGLLRRRWPSRGDPTTRALTVAAAGAFTGWLVHTSVDWMALMPGLTGIALAGAAVLTGDEAEGGARRRPLPWPALAVALLVIGIGASFLVRQTLADRYRIDGQAQLASSPQQALRDANRALAYDSDLLAAWYLKAAAYARLGDYASSRATLLAATRREPHAWVTWALLGDLSVRGRDFAGARAAYGRAFELNPRNTELRTLAANPRVALRQAG
jgi:hypothetical protein